MCARSSKSLSFLWVPLIVRDNDVAVVRERVKLVFYSTAYSAFCSAFAEPKVTALYECSVRCTICRSLVLSSLTSNQFELQRSLIRINEHLPWSSELQARGIWRRSSELLVFRILWHLVFRIFKSSDAGDVHQNFCLQNLQHLIRTIFFRSWDLFIRTSCLRVFRMTSWQIFRTCWRWLSSDQKHVFRSALSDVMLARSTSNGVTSASKSESVLRLKSTR